MKRVFLKIVVKKIVLVLILSLKRFTLLMHRASLMLANRHSMWSLRMEGVAEL